MLATGLFRRAHVDVEPYALNTWITDQPATVAAFLGLLSALRADDPRKLEADVPFWYGEIPASGATLADAVLSRVDAVTVMSYRDTATGPNSMTAVAADMLSRGSLAGKPVRLGAETGRLDGCPHCTFYEEGRQRLVSVLTQVDAFGAGYATFVGIAIHHYTAWIALRP